MLAGEQVTKHRTLSARGQTAWVPILDLLFTSCVMLGRQRNLSDKLPDLKMGMMMNVSHLVLRTVPSLGIINIGYP